MQPLVLATPPSHDRRMGVALLVFMVLAGALGVAKARRYPFNARGLSAESPPSPPLPRWVRIEYTWLMVPRSPCGQHNAYVTLLTT
jgi:hypothetical protein